MLKSLFKGKAEGTFIQLFRYCFVGGAAFLVDFGVLYLLTKFAGMSPVPSATISFILGLITNYLLSIAWVFNNRKMGSRWMEFLVFALIGVLGLVFNDIIIYFFTHVVRERMVVVLAKIFSGLGFEQIVQMNIMLSKIIATIIVFFWNFFARKIILFKTNKQNE